MSSRTFHLAVEHDGLTLAAGLKRLLTDQSWSQVRKLVAGRRVQVNGNLCVDEERKIRAGDVVKLLDHALAPPVTSKDVRLVFVDEHLLVVQKPAGVTTLRHREATDLPQRRKQLQPTLDELVAPLLADHLAMGNDSRPKYHRQTRHPSRTATSGRGFDKRLRIRPVHRLDRDTSGLLVFARTPEAEQRLIHMFAKHLVQRAYVAVAHGRLESQTIDTWLVRDRGDGLRGSSPLGATAEGGLRAVTHVQTMETLAAYTIVDCRLETGRTHQIRIHLSEIGHRLCGEKLYTHPPGQPPVEDMSGAPRQALHAAELAFFHPTTHQPLRFRMPLPKDLKEWLLRLRRCDGATTNAEP